MGVDNGQSAVGVSFILFLVAVIVALLIGVVGFGSTLREALVSAVGIGIGISLGFYIYNRFLAD